MVNSLLCWIIAGMLWATGCAGVNTPVSDTGQPAADGDTVTIPPSPPDGESEAAYLMLVGEVAGQRGQYDVALDYYLQLSHIVKDARVAERATQIALYVKDTTKALEAARLWVERDPGNLSAHRIATVLQVKAGNMSEASDELARLIELKDPELENTLVEMAKWLDADLPKEQALEVMREFAERHPKVPEIRFAYALLASNKGALMVAKSETEQALVLRPGWSRALMLRAQLLMQSGDVKAARSALERALKSDPDNSRLGLLYAQFLARSADYRGAERELKKILEKDSGNHDARFALASVWMELKQYDQARAEFSQLSGDSRWQSQSAFSLGLIDARQGHAEAALRQFDLVGEGPLLFDARFNSISALIGLGRYDEARDRLIKARHDFPAEKIRLYLIEAEMLAKSGDVISAFNVLSEALKDDPRQSELLYTRSLFAEKLGKMDVMESDLREVLAARPDDPAALNALGFSLAVHRPDRLNEAEQYISQALKHRPNDPAILDSYGWVKYRKGDNDGAITYLRKAYGLYPDPEIAAHLGEVLWSMGLKTEAKKIWGEGSRNNPEQEDMRKVREKYPEAFRSGMK